MLAQGIEFGASESLRREWVVLRAPIPGQCAVKDCSGIHAGPPEFCATACGDERQTTPAPDGRIRLSCQKSTALGLWINAPVARNTNSILQLLRDLATRISKELIAETAVPRPTQTPAQEYQHIQSSGA